MASSHARALSISLSSLLILQWKKKVQVHERNNVLLSYRKQEPNNTHREKKGRKKIKQMNKKKGQCSTSRQSTLPVEPPFKIPSFPSSRKKPPPLPKPRMPPPYPPRDPRFRNLRRAKTAATMKEMMKMELETMRWLAIKERVWKNADSIVPMVDLDLSLGGLLMTRGIVSRIEVREGMIGAPLAAVSQ